MTAPYTQVRQRLPSAPQATPARPVAALDRCRSLDLAIGGAFVTDRLRATHPVPCGLASTRVAAWRCGALVGPVGVPAAIVVVGSSRRSWSPCADLRRGSGCTRPRFNAPSLRRLAAGSISISVAAPVPRRMTRGKRCPERRGGEDGLAHRAASYGTARAARQRPSRSVRLACPSAWSTAAGTAWSRSQSARDRSCPRWRRSDRGGRRERV